MSKAAKGRGEKIINSQVTELEKRLNDFSLDARLDALARLSALAKEGAVPLPPEANAVNMHCHTFFSFNAYGYSPAGLAWLARQRGFKAIGIIDFDVLDGVDEFLGACDKVCVRGSTGIETRVYIPEFATREINSPGEPGISYHIAIGFTSGRVPEGSAPILRGMRERAARRNRELVARVNVYLDPVKLDYDRDVLPLTPSGNATERHILAAYVRAAESTAGDPDEFWARKLDLPLEQVKDLRQDAPRFQNLIRLKLMKRGGVGYVQPGPESFPGIDEVNQFVLDGGGLPCLGWLDGTSPGEHAIEELADLSIRKGAVAMNIIPDRNWNIADPETRRLKLQKLYDVVNLAEQLALPLNVGTEMNAYGQKLVDDFDAPELAPVRSAFLEGAHFVYGHTVLQRASGLGYGSAWAIANLPSRRERNAFYTELGYSVGPGAQSLNRLRKLDGGQKPAALLRQVKAT
jgi:hypothetical protein